MSTRQRTREAVLAELGDVAARRRAAQGEADRLYVRLVELYVEARERVDPPLLLREIAGAASATVVAVDAAITKYQTRRNGG